MEDENDAVSEGVSRRSALKRIGVGAAVVWSAPSLLSMGTPAFAAFQSIVVSECECQLGQLCSGQGTPCQGVATCNCSPMLDGKTCFCWQGPHASCSSFLRCDPALQNCPGGAACVPTCCYGGGNTGVCVAACGGVNPAPLAGAVNDGSRTDGK